MRKIILNNILGLAVTASLFGIGGLVILVLTWPGSLFVILAAFCGWGVGLFHGVYAEILRDHESREP